MKKKTVIQIVIIVVIVLGILYFVQNVWPVITDGAVKLLQVY